MKRRLWPLLACLVLAALFAGCAATSMRSVWVDETYRTQPRKFLIIGVAKQDGTRRVYEDEFALLLKKKGLDAYPSYAYLPAGKVDSATAVRKITELGVDAVLVTRLLDKRTVQNYYPPTTTYVGPSYYPSYYYGGWYGYYGYGFDYVASPGYTTTEDYYSLETNVYDTIGKRLVWSGMTETTITSASPSVSVIKEFIHVVADNMKKKGIIP